MSTASQLASNPIPTGQSKDRVSRETRNEKPETELQPFLIQQRPAEYTAENQAVWQLLFARRMKHLRQVGSSAFLRGIQAIGLEPVLIPDLLLMNQRLEPITGWRAVAVSGFLDPTLFFQCLAERRFPTTVIVRPMQQLDYLPEPDIFHDVFGHVPMHADPVFADFLQRFGAIASTARNQAEVRMLTRLFWFTVEFGLIREPDSLGSKAMSSALETGNRKLETASLETRNSKLETDVKVYGSGLISSHADCVNALGPNCERRPFVLDEVLAQEFEIDHLQPVLFVIDSHQQLFDAVQEVRKRMEKGDLVDSLPPAARVLPPGATRLCAHDHSKPAAPACLQDLP
jgi:phenylalanine-4-hydroxylase